MAVNYILLGVLLALSGFFSGAETAFTTLSILQIHEMEQKKGSRGRLVKKLLGQHDILLTTILIGNNLVNIGASAIATKMTIEIFGNRYIGAMTFILTFIILVFGEVTPKQAAIIHNEFIALSSVRVIYLFSIIFRPVVFVISAVASTITSIFKSGGDKSISLDRILQMVRLGENLGIVEKYETQLVRNVFRFNDVTVQAIMTHRRDVFSLPAHLTSKEAISEILKSGFSRIPVYRDNPEEIAGIILFQDVVKMVDIGRPEVPLKDLMHKPFFVSPAKRVNEMFSKFKTEKLNIAVALDEYGGLAGIVTMENVIEELLGELYDEYEKKDSEKIINLGGNSYQISADIPLDQLNDALNTRLPKGKYTQTLAGLLADVAGHIPEQNETIQTSAGQFVIEKIAKNRIISVRFVPSYEKHL